MKKDFVATHTKILFEYEISETEVCGLESMWAVPVEGGYKIDNIPFYAKEIACEDIVSADLDEGGMLRFSSLIKASGHSTVRLWFKTEKDVKAIRDQLEKMGCTSEISDLARLVAVDIPSSVSYELLKTFLQSNEDDGVFEYEEACLGFLLSKKPH